MRTYWLLDQHNGDGPTALVQTDGSLHIVDIIQFGPGITSLAKQQELYDKIIGKIAPTLKPLVDASSLTVDGVDLRDDLDRGGASSSQGSRRGPGNHQSAGKGRKGQDRNLRGSRGER